LPVLSFTKFLMKWEISPFYFDRVSTVDKRAKLSYSLASVACWALRWHSTIPVQFTVFTARVCVCLSLSTPVFSVVEGTLWVLPFTSGGFLYVALVKTVPDLLKENDLK
jgi:hypothetical protein